MASLAETLESPRVEFRSPRMTRLVKLFKGVFATVILTAFLAAGLLGGIVTLWPNHQPDWAIALGFVILFSFIGWMFWIFDRLEATRIILEKTGIWIGGRFFGRLAAYEDLGLIKLEKPENAIGKVQQVVMERKRGRPLSIWLKQPDAEACFAALRTMCEHAPAIDLERVYEPADATFADEARAILCREFQKRARRALSAAIVTGAIGISVVVGLIAAGSAGGGWFWATALLMGAAGSSLAYIDNRRAARSLRNGDWMGMTPTDSDETAGDSDEPEWP